MSIWFIKYIFWILDVNEKTGEVLLQAEADYEKETKLIFLAVPTDGSLTIKVTVEILDENDNTPEFPVKDINLEISEYARIDTELVLPSAVDPDSERYAIKKYFIAGGNVNNVFRLATSKLNNAMYVDLVVNGQLDREYRDRYDLVVEAIDGGEPAKRGRLNVHVIILDANDNAPEFLHSRYSAQLTANASVGAKVIAVKARDADAGENARVTYRLAENQFNTQGIIPFKINAESGEITVDSSPLNPGTTFELIVIAADHGVPQPLESTVFVTINIESSSAGASKYDLNIVWLTEDGSARINEDLPLGYILARISVRDYGSESLHLKGVDSLCLKQTDIPSVYLVLVCGPIDREVTPELHIQFSLSGSNEDIILDHPIIVEILDVNDNSPKWNNTEFSVTFNRQSEKQPQSIYRFIAEDSDSGENARIRYSLDSNDFFDIEPETGILFAKNEIDCRIGNEITFNVIATDNGDPSLNSSAKVIVNVIDTDSKPPIFEKSLYEITTKEDAEISTCLLQVCFSILLLHLLYKKSFLSY
uniref:Cadherin domain-containing protein n=1 Tax=Panagrolaimus superbus TaxID=310955 RepID=A0A914YD80_9BILA